MRWRGEDRRKSRVIRNVNKIRKSNQNRGKHWKGDHKIEKGDGSTRSRSKWRKSRKERISQVTLLSYIKSLCIEKK